MKDLLKTHQSLRKIETLVENRTVYGAEFAELNIYETHQKAEGVYLKFDFPILASMISGKKIMHLEDLKRFDFLPGESVVLPSNKKMIIDFPEATLNNPTQCLALGIDNQKIEETVNMYQSLTEILGDEQIPLQLNSQTCHLANDPNIEFLIQRLMNTFIQTNKAKDALLDIMIKELIVRLLQTKAKLTLIKETSSLFDNNRMAFIVKYIREHFKENISVDSLAEKACMSTSNFYKKFKNTFGETPIDYLNTERIKFAKKLIRNSNKKIVEIAELAGFNSSSYFNRIFKKTEGITPNQYRLSLAI
ncbi:AraC family transcriptional regulator [Psychroflexus maritimus]|uniref:AraC family transcriptional regulator n=1 Tax=Psychroflexus maritimus TaxID=2714865 RepID=A0A967AC32_9FLAO|nr:AraC family transcriptional regulator [Psychroflexus maritimus]NGZ89517.1 AraC family transcriptional regulator [Psychroflexus maritimus]